MHRFPLISSKENRLNFDLNQPRENSFEIDVNHPASINKQPSKTKSIVREIWRLGTIPENGLNTNSFNFFPFENEKHRTF